MRVLLVDDDPRFRELVRELLVQSGVSVTIVGEGSDGDEAVALALETSPDVILMDLEMPRLDGAAAALAIKRDLPDVRVVMLSASARAADAAETAAVELVPKHALDGSVLAKLLRN